MANDSLPVLFSGQAQHFVDDKNRITIPSGWRSEEGDTFFLVPDQSNTFLNVMPPDQFRKVSEAATNHPAVSSRDRRIFLRHYYSRAELVKSDRQGRFVLLDHFCKMLHL